MTSAPDEQFDQKVENINSLYQQAPELAQKGERVVSIDELSGVQALERKHPGLAMRPGKVERREFEYIRYIQIAVTIISISVHLFNTRNTNRKESVIEIITIYVIGLSGWFGIMSGLFGHILYADEVATSIGWPLNSGFQMELGFASIGIGLVGFLSFWNKGYWLPFIIMKFIFGWGAGYTHILHMMQHNNFSPSNTGIVVYWDFLFPLVMIVLYVLYQRQQRN